MGTTVSPVVTFSLSPIGEDEEKEESFIFLARPYLIFIFLLGISTITIVGNYLVIITVRKVTTLHTATNYFIASLALADMLMGAVVIPFEAITELLGGRWLFGLLWCDLWRALDVLTVTASILNLCAISMDRYLAISEPFSYQMRMTPGTSVKIILAVWLCAGCISLPAIIYWRWARVDQFPPETCLFTEDPWYLIVSSAVSFYIPLCIMLFTYFRVYQAAVRQTRNIQMGFNFYSDRAIELHFKMKLHRDNNSEEAGRGSWPCIPKQEEEDLIRTFRSQDKKKVSLPTSTILSQCGGKEMAALAKCKRRGSLALKKIQKFSKEKKAAKTLFIVLGGFIICWTPFFIINVAAGFWPAHKLQQTTLFSIFTWLGWLNSSMNPFIYAARSPEFRRSFGKIMRWERVAKWQIHFPKKDSSLSPSQV